MPVLVKPHILAPIDFSECSDRAYQYAQTLARALEGTIHLIHVVELIENTQQWGYVYTEIGTIGETIKKDVSERLQQRVNELSALGISASYAVLHGASYIRIVEYALKHHSDLIVMGTHGKKGLERLILGSTTERVIRTASCPVLAVNMSDTAQ